MSTKQTGNHYGSSKTTHSHAKHPKGKEENQDENIEKNDDDFLSGDNKSRPYPYNQNNPNEGHNKQMSPIRGSNPNIGGNESEYETSTPYEKGYEEEAESPADTADGIVNRRDPEEINRHDDEIRYSSPWGNHGDEDIQL